MPHSNTFMYIEDIIVKLYFNNTIPFGTQLKFLRTYENKFLSDLADQVVKGIGLTEKQFNYLQKIFKKYQTELSLVLKTNIEIYINNPTFRFALRATLTEKTIKIINTDNGKIISVSFPYNEILIQNIRDYQKKVKGQKIIGFGFGEYSDIKWNSENRYWEFKLKEEHVSWLKSNFSNFYFDEEFKKYTDQITEIEKNIDKYVPMIIYDGDFKYINVSSNIPQPNSNNLVEVLIHAKKYGINIWDDSINYALDSLEINPIIKSYFNHSYNEPFVINEENSSLKNIEEIIEYSQSVLFVIPGGNELLHLEKIYEHLKSKDVKSKEISVMFRLDNNSGKVFNEFVKNNELNSPLSKNTKYVFISGKLPKPVLAIQDTFELIIYFGNTSAHYTLKNFIKNHYNVITMNLIKNNREFNFGNL